MNRSCWCQVSNQSNMDHVITCFVHTRQVNMCLLTLIHQVCTCCSGDLPTLGSIKSEPILPYHHAPCSDATEHVFSEPNTQIHLCQTGACDVTDNVGHVSS